MPIVIETYEEFVERHARGKPLARIGEGRWLLADGAAVTNNGFGPSRHEPPADPRVTGRIKCSQSGAKLLQPG